MKQQQTDRHSRHNKCKHRRGGCLVLAARTRASFPRFRVSTAFSDLFSNPPLSRSLSVYSFLQSWYTRTNKLI